LNVYADTSFLVPSCIHDSHTQQVALRMATEPLVWVTPLNRAEVANAIYRYVFRKAISAHEARSAWLSFEHDCRNGTWSNVQLPAAAWETAIALARRYGPALGNRTLDSLHVASALELGADRFWTFDERQARLAEASGLNTRP
jgi:predicted nucleic acid-binding protein